MNREIFIIVVIFRESGKERREVVLHLFYNRKRLGNTNAGESLIRLMRPGNRIPQFASILIPLMLMMIAYSGKNMLP